MISILLFVSVSAAGTPAPTPLERAEAALDAGDLTHASAILEEALVSDPQDADALWAAARLALRRQHTQRGIELLQRLLKLDPNNDEARFELAQALYDEGEQAAARTTVDSVLERHPQYPPALLLKLGMDGYIEAPTGRRTRWRPQVRAGVTAGFDSNVALDPGTVSAASRQKAGVMGFDAAAVVNYDVEERPATFFLRFATMQALNQGPDEADLANLMPTSLEAGAIAQRPLGAFVAAGDLRVQELFVNQFATEVQRLVAPSLWGGRRFGAHFVRLLGGAEWRQPVGLTGDVPTSLTLKVALREQVRLTRSLLMIDGGVRQNTALGESAAERDLAVANVATLGTGFQEAYASIYAEYALTQSLGLLAQVVGQARRFDDVDLRESTYSAQLGARATFGFTEVQLFYDYARNFSDPARAYDRHQAGAALRFWYD